MVAEWFVDVRDTARLHVAALSDSSIKNERLFAFSEAYNWNSILAALRRVRPDHKFPEDIPDHSRDLMNILPRARADEILRKNFGRPLIGLDESLKANVAHLK